MLDVDVTIEYMSDWFSEFNGAFFISLATLFVGALGVEIRACISSKCSHTDLIMRGEMVLIAAHFKQPGLTARVFPVRNVKESQA